MQFSSYTAPLKAENPLGELETWAPYMNWQFQAFLRLEMVEGQEDKEELDLRVTTMRNDIRAWVIVCHGEMIWGSRVCPYGSSHTLCLKLTLKALMFPPGFRPHPSQLFPCSV